MRRLWRRTSEESDIDTLRSPWTQRTTWHILATCLCQCKNTEITSKRWGPSKSKCSEPKGSEKFNPYSEDAPPWTHQLKIDHHMVTTSLTVPTGGPVYGVWTGKIISNDSTHSKLIWGNRQDWPRGKRCEDNGHIWLHGTPSPNHQETRKRVRVSTSRREENFRRDNSVKRNQPFGTYIQGQWRHSGVETKINQAQNMGRFQDLLPPSA